MSFDDGRICVWRKKAIVDGHPNLFQDVKLQNTNTIAMYLWHMLHNDLYTSYFVFFSSLLLNILLTLRMLSLKPSLF